VGRRRALRWAPVQRQRDALPAHPVQIAHIVADELGEIAEHHALGHRAAGCHRRAARFGVNGERVEAEVAVIDRQRPIRAERDRLQHRRPQLAVRAQHAQAVIRRGDIRIRRERVRPLPRLLQQKIRHRAGDVNIHPFQVFEAGRQIVRRAADTDVPGREEERQPLLARRHNDRLVVFRRVVFQHVHDNHQRRVARVVLGAVVGERALDPRAHAELDRRRRRDRCARPDRQRADRAPCRPRRQPRPQPAVDQRGGLHRQQRHNREAQPVVIRIVEEPHHAVRQQQRPEQQRRLALCPRPPTPDAAPQPQQQRRPPDHQQRLKRIHRPARRQVAAHPAPEVVALRDAVRIDRARQRPGQQQRDCQQRQRPARAARRSARQQPARRQQRQQNRPAQLLPRSLREAVPVVRRKDNRFVAQQQIAHVPRAAQRGARQPGDQRDAQLRPQPRPVQPHDHRPARDRQHHAQRPRARGWLGPQPAAEQQAAQGRFARPPAAPRFDEKRARPSQIQCQRRLKIARAGPRCAVRIECPDRRRQQPNAPRAEHQPPERVGHQDQRRVVPGQHRARSVVVDRLVAERGPRLLHGRITQRDVRRVISEIVRDRLVQHEQLGVEGVDPLRIVRQERPIGDDRRRRNQHDRDRRHQQPFARSPTPIRVARGNGRHRRTAPTAPEGDRCADEREQRRSGQRRAEPQRACRAEQRHHRCVAERAERHPDRQHNRALAPQRARQQRQRPRHAYAQEHPRRQRREHNHRSEPVRHQEPRS